MAYDGGDAGFSMDIARSFVPQNNMATPAMGRPQARPGPELSDTAVQQGWAMGLQPEENPGEGHAQGPRSGDQLGILGWRSPLGSGASTRTRFSGWASTDS